MTITPLRLLAIGLVIWPASVAAQQRTWVLICHIPPGNPANAHSLSLPDGAVKAHLAHGDTYGRCEGGHLRGGDRPPESRQPQRDNRDNQAQKNDGNQPERDRPSSNERTNVTGAGGNTRRPLDTMRAGSQGGGGGGNQPAANTGQRSGKGPHQNVSGGNGGQRNQPQPSNNQPRMDNGGRGSDRNNQGQAGGGQLSQGEAPSGGGGQRTNNNPQQDRRRVDQAPGGRRDNHGGNTNPQGGSGAGGGSKGGPPPKKGR